MRANYSHISLATKQAEEYMHKRRMGLLPSAKTSYVQLNNQLLEGIPWNRIVSLVGGSSAGKSSILEQMKHDIVDGDPTVDCLSLELEMAASDQVMRYLCRETSIGMKTLKSVRGYERTTEDDKAIKEALHKLNGKSIYSIETSKTVEATKSAILNFIVSQELVEKGKKLLITLDYSGLVKASGNEDKRRVLDDLFEMFIEVKAICVAENIPILIIALLQSNRGMMSSDRIKNDSLHYPQADDISGSSTPFNSSDICIFAVNPSKIRGIDAYGPNRKPIRHFITGLPYIYFHILKNREGDTAILDMIADFSKYKIYDA